MTPKGRTAKPRWVDGCVIPEDLTPHQLTAWNMFGNPELPERITVRFAARWLRWPPSRARRVLNKLYYWGNLALTSVTTYDKNGMPHQVRAYTLNRHKGEPPPTD